MTEFRDTSDLMGQLKFKHFLQDRRGLCRGLYLFLLRSETICLGIKAVHLKLTLQRNLF